MPKGAKLRLDFVAATDDAFLEAAARLAAEGAKSIDLRPAGAKAEHLAAAIRERCPDLVLSTAPETLQTQPDAILLLEEDGDALAMLLHDYLDLAEGTVIAPITGRHGLKAPLLLLSIPKAGTHLLLALARALGFDDGGDHGGEPWPGCWYYVEYSNAHTAANDFFIDSVRRSPFGNRNHPFLRAPVLFNYRNPVDILVSEAHYYHRPGNTAFAGYLANLSLEERLLKLIDDPWLFGSFRQRVGRFLPWLAFDNVIPVSFEELAGDSGGGSRQAQCRLIWSLLLKLQAPGAPDAVAETLAASRSPTFRKGAVGEGLSALTASARAAFAALPQDFMTAFGYEPVEAEARDGHKADPWPRHADAFRRRPLRLLDREDPDLPVLLESDYLGYNLIRYRRFYYGVAQRLGPLDLTSLSDEALRNLPCERRMTALKKRLIGESLLRDEGFIERLRAQLAGKGTKVSADELGRSIAAAIAGSDD